LQFLQTFAVFSATFAVISYCPYLKYSSYRKLCTYFTPIIQGLQYFQGLQFTLIFFVINYHSLFKLSHFLRLLAE